MNLSIIHFSDIHIKEDKNSVLEHICELKAACVSSLPRKGTIIIVISGDISYSGKSAEYKIAEKMLKEIEDYIKEQTESSVHFVFVPGNHDCDFDLNDSVREALLLAPSHESVDINYYKKTVGVQKSYYDFAGKFGLGSDNLINSVEFDVDDEKILFLLGNTAWLSVMHETPGKIIMPTKLYENVDSSKYKVVFAVLHHPIGWMNPDYVDPFMNYIRNSTDILLVGHEHKRDNYEVLGSTWSLYEYHGKELQDSNSSDSAFSVFNFDKTFQNYELINYSWNGSKYEQCQLEKKAYHKNISVVESVFQPNNNTLEEMNDMGFIVNHFAKNDVILPDLFVWPELSKTVLSDEKNRLSKIKNKVFLEMQQNHLNIITGSDAVGKTALAKMIYLSYIRDTVCCLFIDGKTIGNSEIKDFKSFVEGIFNSQYSDTKLNDFRLLPREKRIVIIDDFDGIKVHGERRDLVTDFLFSYFGKLYVFMSSDFEIPSLISSKTISDADNVVMYDILPFGNRKRKELITKWYTLNEHNRDVEEVESRIDNAVKQVNVFIGNGSGFMPAVPIYIIGVLQNGDAVSLTYNGSQYGFLYETMIQKNLSATTQDYSSSGSYNIDIGVLSSLAFYILCEKKRVFSKEELIRIITNFAEKKKVEISSDNFISKMISAHIFSLDLSNGESYKFKYPYIFYYFAGHYIAYHLNFEDVKEQIEYMCGRLYNEDYGNIVIFVCHFANNIQIIETILLHSYVTLEGYELFDFAKSNPVFSDIDTAIEALLPASVGGNDDVKSNKEKRLSQLDEMGINDGNVIEGSDIIDDEITERERDLASISAAFKTLDVMGQVLKNYPGDIDGTVKIQIIDEIYSLGMRSVQAIVATMGYLEEPMVDFIVDRAIKEKRFVRRIEVVKATKKFINMMLAGMVRGMIGKIAASLDSKHLLPAASESLEKANSIATTLILLELKVNCLKLINYQEIEKLKKDFEQNNEKFAIGILTSIITHFLKYNKCDYRLRSKLCSLFEIPEQKTMIESRKQLNG